MWALLGKVLKKKLGSDKTPPLTPKTFISEARFGILDELTIFEVSAFPSANYHPYICPLFTTPHIYIYGLGVVNSGPLGIPY